MAAVTQASHPHTYWVQIDGQEYPDLISKEDFRTKVLEHCINGLAIGKRHSNFRSRAEITAIIEYADEPPEHCPIKSLASWRYGLGRPGTKNEAHWVRSDGQLFKGNEDGSPDGPPLCAIEDYYRILTNIHHEQGHWGRIKFFDFVKDVTSTIKQDTVREFVKHCCAEARNNEMNVDHTARPPIHRPASARAASPRRARHHRRRATHPRRRASVVAASSKSRRPSLPGNSHQGLTSQQSSCHAPLPGSSRQSRTDEELIAALSEPYSVFPDQTRYPAGVADHSNELQQGFRFSLHSHDAFAGNNSTLPDPFAANTGKYADASVQPPLAVNSSSSLLAFPAAVPTYDCYRPGLDVQASLLDNNVNTFPAAPAALPAYDGCQPGFDLPGSGFYVDRRDFEHAVANVQASIAMSGPDVQASRLTINGNDFFDAPEPGAAFSGPYPVPGLQGLNIANYGNDPFAVPDAFRANSGQLHSIEIEAASDSSRLDTITATPRAPVPVQTLPDTPGPHMPYFYTEPQDDLNSVYQAFASGGIDDFMPSMSENAPWF